MLVLFDWHETQNFFQGDRLLALKIYLGLRTEESYNLN